MWGPSDGTMVYKPMNTIVIGSIFTIVKLELFAPT